MAAVIVLYYPDKNRLNQVVDAILPQVSRLYLVDNGVFDVWRQDDRIVYVRQARNTGVAGALNCALELAKEESMDWLVTLDQDTIVPNDLISGYQRLPMKILEQAAMLCPQIDYHNRSRPVATSGYTIVDRCITSASCLHVARANLLKFDERLFIDYVDYDYCMRLKEQGGSIVQVDSLIVDHQLGLFMKFRFFQDPNERFMFMIIHHSESFISRVMPSIL